ncbi:MAG: hypothetical protein M1828_002561 [Chrysothrix sp. TS-e1954]|nr:MAG: hypothetical protein M1828_002561 [Chrysothrix sp. TS-e1954]
MDDPHFNFAESEFSPRPVQCIESDGSRTWEYTLPITEIDSLPQNDHKKTPRDKVPNLKILFGVDQNHDDAISPSLPFSRQSFELLMEAWSLPRSVCRAYRGPGPAFGMFTSDCDRKSGVIGLLYRSKQYSQHNIAIAISVNVSLRSTRAIVIGKTRSNAPYYPFADAEDNIANIRRFLETYSSCIENPLLPALALIDLEVENEKTWASVAVRRIWKLEHRTKERCFGSDYGEQRSKLEYASLNRDLSTTASSGSEHVLRMGQYKDIVNDMREACAWLSANAPLGNLAEIETQAEKLSQAAKLVQTTCKEGEFLAASAYDKAKILLSVLSNTTAQQIALETRRDSSSMKTIALLTLFFLPGSAVAALFSMTMFNWTSDPVKPFTVTHWFWVYWAVTVPLTLFVIAAWLLLARPFAPLMSSSINMIST